MDIADILKVSTLDEFNAFLDTHGRGHWDGVRYNGHEYSVYLLDAQVTVFAGSERGYMKMYRGRGKHSGSVVFARGKVQRNRNGRMTEYVEQYPTAKNAFDSLN